MKMEKKKMKGQKIEGELQQAVQRVDVGPENKWMEQCVERQGLR